MVLTICMTLLSIVKLCDSTYLEYALDYFQEEYNFKDNGATQVKKEFKWDEPLLQLALSFSAEMNGFTDCDIHEASLSKDLKLKLNTTWNDAHISGAYNVNGTYYKIVPLKGNGNFWIELKNFNFFLDTVIYPNNGLLKLLDFKMEFDLNDLIVSISGLTGETDVGEVIQSFIKDLLQNVNKKYKQNLVSFINDFAKTKGNAILKNCTLRTFLELAKFVFVY